MLTNIPIGKRKPPKGQNWQAMLFIVEVYRNAAKTRKTSKKSIVCLEGETKQMMRDKVAKFCGRRHVHIVEGAT